MVGDSRNLHSLSHRIGRELRSGARSAHAMPGLAKHESGTLKLLEVA